MQHHSLGSLLIVVTVAFLVPILLKHLKLRMVPVVVAEIIAGLVIGKSGLNLVSPDVWLEMLSILGFIFLMFLSGVEIDFSFFDKKQKKDNEVNPLKIAFLIFVSIFLISFLLSVGLVALGLIKDPFLMSLIISTISLGVVVPVLKEKQMTETKLGQIILLVTVISDFSTMILLAVYVAFESQDTLRVLSLLLLFVLFFFCYRFIKRFFKIKLFEGLMQGTVQLGTRGVFTLILIFVTLSETLGVEHILGAFLAGIIISLLAPKKEFVHQLDSFGFGFLIPIFFVMVGVKMELTTLFTNAKILILMPILFFCMYIAKIIPSLILRKWYPWREVLSIGTLITAKLSLVIAASAVALEIGVISEELNGALILVSVMTCLISPILFNKFSTIQTKKKKKVSILGSNAITLPISLELEKEGYHVLLYTEEQDSFSESLFEADIVVVATENDQWNEKIGKQAKEYGVERVIVRIENITSPVEYSFQIFSTLNASKTFLKAMIEHPGAIQLVTEGEETIHEVIVGNFGCVGLKLKDIDFFGSALVVRIQRGEHSIVPHGNTEFLIGDKLLISGSPDDIQIIREKVE